MYALNIDIPYDGKRKSCMRAIIIKLHPSCINHKQIQRATGKTAKLHCFCVYAINIYTPCKGKGDKVLKAKQPFFLACTLKKQRVQGLNYITTLVLCVYPIYWYSLQWKGSSVLKVKLHLILVSTRKNSEGPGVKLQNYTVFVCMPFILILLVMERVIK